MTTKLVLVFCVQALLVQCAWGQCPYNMAGAYGMGAPAMAAPYGLTAPGFSTAYSPATSCGWASPAMDFTPTSGGGLPVNSASAIAPVGISVASENAYEGALAVAGELPFVGTVGLEGVLPTTGAGAVNHACGNGRNAMSSEGEAFAPAYGAYGAYAPAAAIGISPATAMATGFAAPGMSYRASWTGINGPCGI